MLPTAQDMIYAMPSIQVNCSASWVGHRASPSRKVLKRRSTGSWKMRNGLITLRAEIIAPTTKSSINKKKNTTHHIRRCSCQILKLYLNHYYERNYSSWWIRHTASSSNACGK